MKKGNGYWKIDPTPGLEVFADADDKEASIVYDSGGQLEACVYIPFDKIKSVIRFLEAAHDEIARHLSLSDTDEEEAAQDA